MVEAEVGATVAVAVEILMETTKMVQMSTRMKVSLLTS
jgi:hypothetical protein